ncbi:MAG: hypothetical protein VB859_19115, partial [Planctomycetaceae bacterium]
MTKHGTHRSLRCRPLMMVLQSGLVLLATSVDARAGESWKYDVEVICSPRYVVNNYQTWCDERDRLWASIGLNFGENTDAYHARHTMIVLVSKDRGVTWQVSDKPWPGPRDDRSVMSDGIDRKSTR